MQLPVINVFIHMIFQTQLPNVTLSYKFRYINSNRSHLNKLQFDFNFFSINVDDNLKYICLKKIEIAMQFEQSFSSFEPEVKNKLLSPRIF